MTQAAKKAAAAKRSPKSAPETEEARIERENKERQDGLRKAYSKATTRLREQRKDEFDRLYSEEAAKLGITWTPKPTAEQKAEQDLNALLAKYPHLADKIREERGEQGDGAPATTTAAAPVVATGDFSTDDEDESDPQDEYETGEGYDPDDEAEDEYEQGESEEEEPTRI